jgi:hypothetical protein
VNLENIGLISEISSSKKATYYMIPFIYEMFRAVKSIDTGNK